MKKAVGIISTIIVGSAILIAGFLFFMQDKREEKLHDYINENYKELEKIAIDQLEGKNVVIPENVEKMSVYNENYVEFATSGLVGFYYSKNDKPMAFENKEVDLIELGDNKYKWQDDYNSGITNKIRKHWYYYRVTK